MKAYYLGVIALAILVLLFMDVQATQVYSLSDADAWFVAEHSRDQAGVQVEIISDVNGDGYDELLVGANADSYVFSWSGQAYLIFGNATCWSANTPLGQADASFTGIRYLDYAGGSISGVGDVDGDGFSDLLVGAWNREGRTYLIRGGIPFPYGLRTSLNNVDASFIGEGTDDNSSISIDGVGDVNGDGLKDFIISARKRYAYAGETYLIFGRPTAQWYMGFSLANADASFIGEAAGDSSGWQVAGIGDFNFDGYDDFAIGAPGNDFAGTQAGQIYLVFGGNPFPYGMRTPLGSVDASFVGENAYDRAGEAVGGGGDVDADGHPDLIVSAPFNDDSGQDAGKCYVIFGGVANWLLRQSLSSADVTVVGETSGDRIGETCVKTGGDLNNDGYAEIGIGTYATSDNGPFTGKAYVFAGRPHYDGTLNASQAELIFVGPEAYDFAGYCFSMNGDLNGNGTDDIAVGAGRNDWVDYPGKTYLFFDISMSGSICATVNVTGNPPVPAQGVTVSVIDQDNNLVGYPIQTNEFGEASFDPVDVGNYSVMIVTPLGYTVSPGETQTNIAVTTNECTQVVFTLNPSVISNECRSLGYWKHQFDVYTSGRGNAQESASDLDAYLDLVHQHFNVLGVYVDLENFDFEDAKNILTVKGGSLMLNRAKQQLFALLLNFSSGRIGNETVVSEDGRVAAEAITLAANLINDGDPSSDELAKDICDLINNGQIIGAGIIPESPVRYKFNIGGCFPAEFSLSQNYPNPFNAQTVIDYALPEPAHVSLDVYDILGRKVTTLINSVQPAGHHHVAWNSDNASSGMYFYKIQAGDFSETKKMLLLK